MRWLATYDPNLPLLDVINDPESSDTATRLAALSLGEGLDSGFYDSEALCDAVSHLWAEIAFNIEEEASEARRELSALLDRGGAYTSSLYNEVKALSPRSASLQLYDHAKRMMDRADMGRIAREAMSQIDRSA